MAKSKRRSKPIDREARERLKDKQRTPEDSKGQNKGFSFELDQWQKEVLETKGKQNLAIRAGRQVGKSTVIAALVGEHAANNKNKSIMVISATERQAYLLFSKIVYYLLDNYRSWIKRGKDRPTKTEIKLNNGSVIRCLPTGLDGLGIRGYTVNLLIADEAAFIPLAVWPAVTPMLATTGGKLILLSTPFGSQGYFYDCWHDDDFKTWHINAEHIAESRAEPQRTFMRDHQEKEKGRLSRLQYAQEYLGEFVDDFRRIFSDELIKRCCVLKRESADRAEYYLGVDVARMGEDASTFQIVKKIDRDTFRHVESIMTQKKYTTETFDKIVELNRAYNFRKIGIDAGSGSLGVGILDFLLREPQVKQKIIALNNLSRNLDHLGERKRTLLKEDMYFNLLALMEKSKIKLLDDDDLIHSLRAIQYEYAITPGKKSVVRIFAARHKYTDLVEGLIRAAYLANAKHLNAFIDWI